ncbi:hypothetical protein LJR039_004344 [Pseudorhodoferax sp. LjRoot39]|uniref:hypothetical protein n=1 Tax=Pseudorhodoferax sp. LjRoot39 TaxID=3342328 RepID=UPI003ECD8C2F
MKQLLDPKYEERAIGMDATRAAKLGETPERACSHEMGTWQHLLWLHIYASEKLRAKEAMQ